jgi:glyoxylase-like metal-dependent hydrolase (beta-lactamase superfamily II)
MRLETFVGGPLETNAFLLIDPETNEALVVDAPAEVAEAITTAVQAAGATVRRIVLTHAHWDHIVDAAGLKEATGAPLAAHPLADERLANPRSDVFALPFAIDPVSPDEHLTDGDDVAVGAHTFTVLYLPGHDPAHIALVSEADGLLFGGDVLFPGGHGRTDILGADQTAMNASLARLLALPDTVTVYPGHGQPTTIGAERAWMQEAAG